MKKLSLILCFLWMAAPSLALAQGTVLQAGPWANGHIPQYTGSGTPQPRLQDGGGAGGGGIGANPNELGLTLRGVGNGPFANAGTGPYGSNICDYDANLTNAGGYHFLCFSPNAQGGPLIAAGFSPPATALPLKFIVNGTTYPFPFTGTGGGNVVGPPSSTPAHLAVWANTSGTLLGDQATLLPAQMGPLIGDVTSSTGGNFTTIAANAVTNAKLAAMTTLTVKANVTGGTAVPTDVALATFFGDAPTASIPASAISGGGTGNTSGPATTTVGHLATWNSVNGTLLADATTITAAQMVALTGDVTNSAGAVATTISPNAVTNAKMATMTTLTVKANVTGGSAVPSDVALATFFGDAPAASIPLASVIGAGGGNVVGPGTTVVGGVAEFNNTSGTLLKQATGIDGLPIGASTPSTGKFTTTTSTASASSPEFLSTGGVPVLSACGTGTPTVDAGSTKAAGAFTVGTGTPTACTVTFDVAYPNHAFCTVAAANAAAAGSGVLPYISAQSASAFTLTLSAGTSSAKFSYICGGN